LQRDYEVNVEGTGRLKLSKVMPEEMIFPYEDFFENYQNVKQF